MRMSKIEWGFWIVIFTFLSIVFISAYFITCGLDTCADENARFKQGDLCRDSCENANLEYYNFNYNTSECVCERIDVEVIKMVGVKE